VILDEFVAATGYARKYAIRLLNHPVDLKLAIERPRRPRYGLEVQQALQLTWTAANHICAKRLVPFLPTLVESLERHGHLQLSEEGRNLLLSVSAATADRILRPYRKQERHGISTTRSGTLLKKQIPIRTFQDWNDVKPGFLEADLVAHCGSQAEGSFLYTLTLTDVATGWTECLPLLNRGQEAVVAALKRAQQLLPFPILGIDTDNGAEFINMELMAYCEQEHITFTRGVLRKATISATSSKRMGRLCVKWLGMIVSLESLLIGNSPNSTVHCGCMSIADRASMKLQTKQREGSKVRRTYDQAQTPMQRLLASGAVPQPKQLELRRVTQALDPLRLLQQLEHLQKALWRHAITSSSANQESTSTRQFSVQLVSSEKVPADGIPGTPPSLLKRARRKKYQTSGRPHDWRTRKDPFEGEWEQITSWLLANPELTGVDIFHKLEQLSPGRYRPMQVRTLQRGLGKLRTRLLVTLDDQWGEEVVNGLPSVPALRAEMVAEVP